MGGTDRAALWYITGLLYLGCAAAMANWAVFAVRRVRAVRSGIVQQATALACSSYGADSWELRRRAAEFKMWMVGSRSAAGHLILPVAAAREFGQQVVREAETTGLTPATLHQVAALARAVSARD
ncbi:hypothetical protein [Streptomyces bacillaris]|uniref:hypothetical protein n=1 Tax=Streptomyces bacillaris TaxID=68179 RepID=UPI00381F3524